MKFNIILFMFFLTLITSCASNQKQVNDLEDKISKLTELLEEKNKKKETPKEEPKEEVKIESPVIKLTLPKIKEVKTDSIKRKIILGEKEKKNFQLLFDSNNYWLIVESKNNESLGGIVIMNIERENKSPESINFFQIKEGVFQAYGEHIQGKVELEIRFIQTDKQPIVFIVEAEL